MPWHDNYISEEVLVCEYQSLFMIVSFYFFSHEHCNKTKANANVNV